jgi:hypothetical protein
MVEMLDAVSRQFAILITMEAEKRGMTVQNFITQALMQLGEKAFRGGR